MVKQMSRTKIELPTPKRKGGIPIRDAILKRRTSREITNASLSLQDLSQLLWTTYGIIGKDEDGNTVYRVVPSAGAVFPLLLYVVMQEGLYLYDAEHNSLELKKDGDLRSKLGYEGLYSPNREAIRVASHIVILAVDNLLAIKASPIMEDVLRFVHLEAGHATQNFILQAVEFGLGTTTITSFDLKKVYRVLELPLNHRPIYILPVGRPKERTSSGLANHRI